MAAVNITEDMREEARRFMEECDGENYWLGFDSYFEDAKYNGFNPVEMVALLQHYGANRDFKDDMGRLAATVAMRGTSLKKIRTKSAKSFIDIFDALVKVYHITDGINQTRGNQSVTLGRIGACFAMPLVWAVHKQKANPLIPRKEMGVNYPLAMCSPHFGAIIPSGNAMSSDDWAILTKAYLAHQIRFDAIINRSKKTGLTPPDQIRTYLEIQMSSPVYSTTTRLNALTQMGILKVGAAGTIILSHEYRETLVTLAQSL